MTKQTKSAKKQVTDLERDPFKYTQFWFLRKLGLINSNGKPLKGKKLNDQLGDLMNADVVNAKINLELKDVSFEYKGSAFKGVTFVLSVEME